MNGSPVTASQIMHLRFIAQTTFTNPIFAIATERKSAKKIASFTHKEIDIQVQIIRILREIRANDTRTAITCNASFVARLPAHIAFIRMIFAFSHFFTLSAVHSSHSQLQSVLPTPMRLKVNLSNLSQRSQ
jgi:hypothetical protein